MISVHIAASSPVVRAGLEAVIGSLTGLSVVSLDATENLEQHLDTISADVLLLVLPFLTEDWIATLASSGIPAVILADTPDAALHSAALHAGIRAVLSPDATPPEITAALTAAAAGLIAIHPSSLDSLNQAATRSRRQLDEPLTPRELEVLTLLAEGHSNKLIARSLEISEHTVKFHVTAIMSKLHAGSRTDAVMQAIRQGLIMI